jgi:hypothetical protein
MKKLLLPCILLFSAHAAPAMAACTDIPTLPATISASGNYCLSANHAVNITTGAALTIDANNVELDCANHSITNAATSATGSSSGIALTDQNTVTIRNCRIHGGFTNGIYALQTLSAPNKNYYINIVDNYIAGPYLYGILAYGSAIEITGNRIYDVGGQTNSFAMGMRLAGSTLAGAPRFFLVRDNLVAGTNSPTNAAYGIYSDNSVAGIFIDNGVSGTSGKFTWGFRLAGTVNRVTDNHIVGSGKASDWGIQSNSATDACFDNYIRATTPTQGCNAELGNY